MGRSVDPFTLALVEKSVSVAQIAITFACMSDEPDKLDAVAVHGLSQGMYQEGSLFDHAVGMGRRYQCPIWVVGGDGRATSGSTPQSAWIGSDALVQELVSHGASRGDLIVMDPITNSKEEALAIVRKAEEHRFENVGSVSVAYHGGRMFPYLVAAMKEVRYWIDYRMLLPKATNWWAPILGSQGVKMATCFESAMTDALKIEDHIRRGFAATFQEVFFYFKNRKEIVETPNWDFPGSD
jgi:hypothetical protein